MMRRKLAEFDWTILDGASPDDCAMKFHDEDNYRGVQLTSHVAKVVERNWDLIEVDIVNAFATSTLPEPVYMEVLKI